MCSHKWRVVYELGTVYFTISRHCLHVIYGLALFVVHVCVCVCAVCMHVCLGTLQISHLGLQPTRPTHYAMSDFYRLVLGSCDIPHGERHIVKLFACFGVCAFALLFCAKSEDTEDGPLLAAQQHTSRQPDVARNYHSYSPATRTCGSLVPKWKCEVGAHLGLSCALRCLCARLLCFMHARQRAFNVFRSFG